MKRIKKDILYWILIIMPFAMTICFIPFLPDKIPSQLFDLEAEWESKYAIFKINIFMAILEIIYYLGYIWHVSRKSEKSIEEREYAVLRNAEKNNKTLMLVMFFILTIWHLLYLILSYQVTHDTEMNLLNIASVAVGVSVGICWIVLGNVLPRMHEYKDPFSRKWKNASPQILRKVNHFSGIAFMLCGIAILILTFTLHSILILILTMVLTIVTALLATIYSYVIYTKEQKQANL